MMKSIKFSLVACLLLGFMSLSAQSVINIRGQKLLKIDLYTGILDIESTSGNQLIVEQALYDYDSFDESGQLEKLDEGNRNEIAIKTYSDSIVLRDYSSRDIRYLKLTVPEGMNMNLNINHYGKIAIGELKQATEISIYQGEISVESVMKALSAAVVRDGHITIGEIHKTTSVVAMSTYSGDLSISLPPRMNATYSLYSELGEIKNGIGLRLESTKELSTTVNGASKKSNWFSAQSGNGNGTIISMTNVNGEIVLKEF